MNNIPAVKLGLVAVSRNCFPIGLSRRRCGALAETCQKRHPQVDLYRAETIVETEADLAPALAELENAACNALVVYLGNFGPETPETLLAQQFPGPVMFLAAAEESGGDLVEGRGDAYCGLLNASYNLKLREIAAFIPQKPVGNAEALAEEMARFVPIARALIGLKRLKIITFGPRPQDFLACNAPIKPLYSLGVEIEENSELDLWQAYQKMQDDTRIEAVAADMARELGLDLAAAPASLRDYARYELTLTDWAEAHRGAREHVVFANKCWPAFQFSYGFVPCYVNSRLTGRGYPVACEVDIYGALSEYIGQCVSDDIVTLLDVNNTVPEDMYAQQIAGKHPYGIDETFMGFHCGNTCSKKLQSAKLAPQIIMARTGGIETSGGTLNGDLVPGATTLFRLQSTAGGALRAYVAEGEILPVPTRSFGGIGVVAIRQMDRFYRHVLIEQGFPHHGAFTFGAHGRALFDLFRLLGVENVAYNQPATVPYPSENPF